MGQVGQEVQAPGAPVHSSCSAKWFQKVKSLSVRVWAWRVVPHVYTPASDMCRTHGPAARRARAPALWWAQPFHEHLPVLTSCSTMQYSFGLVRRNKVGQVAHHAPQAFTFASTQVHPERPRTLSRCLQVASDRFAAYMCREAERKSLAPATRWARGLPCRGLYNTLTAVVLLCRHLPLSEPNI